MKEKPSRQTLDEVPCRVLVFLIAVGESPPIRSALAARGYDQAEHEYAWSNLQAVGSFPRNPAPLDSGVRQAIAEIDAWDEPNFACIAATLARLHPEQSGFLFEGLRPSQGPKSVVGVSLLLDRLDALEGGLGRLSTRAEDHAALATLATRGYTPAERARLRALVNVARNGAAAAPTFDGERAAALLVLYRWLTDWATTARAVISRRDHLIRLGLAKRRKRKDEGGTEGETPPEQETATPDRAPPTTTTTPTNGAP